MNTQSVLTHLIRAGRDALHLEKTLTDIGYKETPYFNLYGEITDAIYGILDEDTETIEQSKAYAAIHDCFVPDETCAEELAEDLWGHDIFIPDIPKTTMEVISEAAYQRGVKPGAMIRLILGEWAMREMIMNKALG